MDLRGLVFLLSLGVCGGCASSRPVRPEAASASTAEALPDTGEDLKALSDEELARKLMELTGAANLGKQVADSMAVSLAKMPGLPAGFMEAFMKRVKPDDLVDLVVPVYVKHYDRKTMTAAIVFYRSPSGKTLTSQLPAVTREAMAAGEAWGRELARKTLEDLRVERAR